MNKIKEELLDRKIERMVVELNKTNVCHYLKPDGALGKEYMTETMQLRDCLNCGDEKHCWSHGQLKDLIEEERKTLLNQDY